MLEVTDAGNIQRGNETMENTITQSARFSVGQKVSVCNDEYIHRIGKVREVVKGEEDWMYYVDYNCRDHMGRTAGVYFAEEMTGVSC